MFWGKWKVNGCEKGKPSRFNDRERKLKAGPTACLTGRKEERESSFGVYGISWAVYRKGVFWGGRKSVDNGR